MLQSRDLRLDCSPPVAGGGHVMGILNVTPDSFSDGGLYLDPKAAVARAGEMAREGARLIDVGGASSRPKGQAYGAGAHLVGAEEELERILPVISEISRSLPGVWISVDTFRADVARAALEAGAHMINDITALRFDPEVASVCAEFDAPLVLMHSLGLPGDMPHESASDDIVGTVCRDLEEATRLGTQRGCRQFVLDPGFGFGKTVDDNLTLIARLEKLRHLGWPVLVGVSRKSTLGHIVAREGVVPPPEDRVHAGLGVSAVALRQGACIFRTHDVRATVDFLGAMEASMRTLERNMPYHGERPDPSFRTERR